MTIEMENIEISVNAWTWRDLNWLPEDSPEIYPNDPDNYQCSEGMAKALGQVKALTIDSIKSNFEVFIRISPVEQIAEIIWDTLEPQFDKLGDYGQTDTASREAYMYKVDSLFKVIKTHYKLGGNHVQS